jgi:chemotaxis protein MotB
MQQGGLGPKQVAQVRGYADELLRKPTEPLDASNRRISMLVQNLEAKDDATKAEAKPNGEKTLGSTPK